MHNRRCQPAVCNRKRVVLACQIARGVQVVSCNLFKVISQKKSRLEDSTARRRTLNSFTRTLFLQNRCGRAACSATKTFTGAKVATSDCAYFTYMCRRREQFCRCPYLAKPTKSVYILVLIYERFMNVIRA